MKRTKTLQTNDIKVLSEIMARAALSGKLGYQYAGNRDIYEALGYQKDLIINDYIAQYSRQDIARAIIDKPCNATWSGDITILESDDDNDTPLEKEWKILSKKLKLVSKLKRADILTGIGRFGALLLGFDDTKTTDDFKNTVSGKRKLLYVKPLSELNVTVQTWEDNTGSERYGLPLLYNVTLPTAGDNSKQTIVVNQERIIHITDSTLDNEVYGTPRLKPVFNRLKDIEKIVGGSAEMFWRGARPGYQGKVDKDYQLTQPVREDLINQLDEYENNLRRFLVNEGVSYEALSSQVADPSAHVKVQLQMVSAEKGIPLRILTGSERGELASTQDKDSWLTLIEDRRVNYAEPNILNVFIDRCITFGVLPAPKEEYSIQWSDLWAKSDKEKAEIGKIRAEALKAYAATPGVSDIVPFEAFFEYFLGLDADNIEYIIELQKAGMDEEENDFNQDLDNTNNMDNIEGEQNEG